MTEVVAMLAFELYLIACCLFAPVDRKGFEIELREGQSAQGPVVYVERTDAGFMIFGNKEHKGDALSVRKSGDLSPTPVAPAKAGLSSQPQNATFALEDDGSMKHLGTIVFGSLTALTALGVLWLAHGAGTGEPGAVVFGLALSPVFFLVFVGPFALLFLMFLFRRRRH